MSFDEIWDIARAEPGEPEPSVAPLISRELDVLRLVAPGDTNGQVAHALFLSPRTVKTGI